MHSIRRLTGAAGLAAIYSSVFLLVPLARGEEATLVRWLVLFSLVTALTYILLPRLIPAWEREGSSALRPNRARLAFVAVAGTAVFAFRAVASVAVGTPLDAEEIGQLLAFLVVTYVAWPTIERRRRRT